MSPVTASDVLVPITTVADKLGVTRRALRHYEALGLVRASRTRRAMRHYDRETVESLTVIADLRRADVPLATIRDIVALRHDPSAYHSAIRSVLTAMREDKARELDTIETLLGALDGELIAGGSGKRTREAHR